MKKLFLGAAATMLLAVSGHAQQQTTQQSDMGFFVTSGIGRSAGLGGLSGADQLCQSLAQAVGAGAKTWHAYLSTQGAGAVNARDRIGKGPWKNSKGVVIASNLAELHGNNNLTKQTALTEKGAVVAGEGEDPVTHDVLTGSQSDGTAFAGSEDRTCGNWTKSGDDGSAMLGHSDRTGLRDDAPSHSWNSSHPSRGCSADGLRSTGGAGRLYCFAVQ
ncbi:MAG TPA: hypothetical protein VJR47_11470 [Stellaceae bacterium]|nr:hypothetical protein [Stellaceae bacterium]